MMGRIEIEIDIGAGCAVFPLLHSHQDKADFSSFAQFHDAKEILISAAQRPAKLRVGEGEMHR